METDETIKKNKELLEEINQLLKSFTEESKNHYLKKIDLLLNKYNNGKQITDETTLYIYPPQALNLDLEDMKNELKNNIKNNIGIITPLYNYSQYFKRIFNHFLEKISSKNYSYNISYVQDSLKSGLDYIKTVGVFLNDQTIDITEKEKHFEIITDTLILILSNDLFWSNNDITFLTLLNLYKEENSFNYNLLITYLLKRLDNETSLTPWPNTLLSIKAYQDKTESANFLIAISTLCDYKQIINKYKVPDKDEEDKNKIISYIVSKLPELSDEDLRNLYEIILNKEKENSKANNK